MKSDFKWKFSQLQGVLLISNSTFISTMHELILLLSVEKRELRLQNCTDGKYL